MAAEVGLFQRVQPAQQVGFTLKVRQPQRFFRLQTRRAGGHPVCRIEKQRLRLYPRLRATGMQQPFADLKAASGMSIQRQPAVDAHQRCEGIGVVERQLQADQRPQRMADHAVAGDAERGQGLCQLTGHLRQGVIFRQGVRVIAGATLVVTDHLVLLFQRG